MLIPALTAEAAVRTLTEAIREAGIRAETCDDLRAFVRAHARLREDPVTPLFEAMGPADPGFWLGAYDRGGKLCGIHAAALIERAAPDLRTHLTRHRDLYMPTGRAVDPWRSEIRSAVCRQIEGRVGYHGEGYLTEGWRGRGVGGLLVRLLQVQAWLLWRTDCVFAFTIPRTSSWRFSQAMGYHGFEPEAAVWCDARGTPVHREGLVWSGRAALRRLAADPLLLPRAARSGGAFQQAE